MVDEGRATTTAATGSPSYGHYDIKEAGDLISRLPDELLQDILSFITPTKYAIRTSVLSKRWRHVWSDTPCLSFYADRPDADSINQTLARYRAPKMMRFRICSSRFDKLPYMESWIELAMSRKVENLSLEVGHDNYSIPESLYINSSFKQLSLLLGSKYMIPKCSVSWTSLKNLSLRACEFSDESMANILSGCPILESLSLLWCDNLRVLDLSKSPRLITLEIINRYRLVVGPTQIVAPHIRCLVMAEYPQLPCPLVDVSSLSQAKLDISPAWMLPQFKCRLEGEFFQTTAIKMLDKCQNVEKLTLGANFLKMVSLAELSGVSFPKLKAKALTLETMISQHVIPGMVRVLQNSPALKKLIIHTVHRRDICSIPEEFIDKYLASQGFNSDQCWSSEARVFKNISRRNVKSTHVASLMKLVLKATKTLDKMVLRLDGYLNDRGFQELRQMVQVLLSHNNNNNNISVVLSSTKKKKTIHND